MMANSHSDPTDATGPYFVRGIHFAIYFDDGLDADSGPHVRLLTTFLAALRRTNTTT